MAYWKRWRQNRAEALAEAMYTSSSSESEVNVTMTAVRRYCQENLRDQMLFLCQKHVCYLIFAHFLSQHHFPAVCLTYHIAVVALAMGAKGLKPPKFSRLPPPPLKRPDTVGSCSQLQRSPRSTVLSVDTVR